MSQRFHWHPRRYAFDQSSVHRLHCRWSQCSCCRVGSEVANQNLLRTWMRRTRTRLEGKISYDRSKAWFPAITFCAGLSCPLALLFKLLISHNESVLVCSDVNEVGIEFTQALGMCFPSWKWTEHLPDFWPRVGTRTFDNPIGSWIFAFLTCAENSRGTNDFQPGLR